MYVEQKLVNIGNMVYIYLQEDVADLFTNEVDGIQCASVLMGYDVEFFLRKVRQNNKKSNITMCFHKQDDFYFEISFVYDLETRITESLCLVLNPEMLQEKNFHSSAHDMGLSINYLNQIEVNEKNKFEKLLKYIKYLI